MQKRILIVVDKSGQSRRAVEYAILMDNLIKESNYILFNVQPTVSEYLLHDAHFDKNARLALNKLMDKNRRESEKILNEFKELMVAKGIEEERIELATQPRAMDVAKDILIFAKQRACDLVLIGKRGISKVEEMLTHSVSTALAEHIQTVPLWSVNGEVKSTKVAVAIDGSEGALRAVDHVGFMFGGNPDMRITLLHVMPKLRDYCPIEFDEEEKVDDIVVKGDKRCVESFFVHAKKLLKNAGIKEYQLEIKELPSIVSVSKTIVNEIENGDYGTLILGRSGISESFFLGSVSRYCFYTIKDCAVCIVP
ncbi:MAG: hypothetical protein DRG39_01345 [Deltaproteobacteria bacterium]|nr:MAG: hypothetical protein DRG39_01345 [Deltaproteobacteria bacterium]